MQKKIFSLFVISLLLLSSISVIAEDDFYDRGPDMQREIEDCAEFVIKEFGVDPQEAKEKCSKQMKEGEMRRPPNEFYDDRDFEERDFKRFDDEDYYEDEFEFDRPEGKYGYDRPSIEGHEEYYIRELIFDKIGNAMGNPEELMEEYCDNQEEFLEIIYERAEDVINNAGAVCEELKSEVTECQEDIEKHCNFYEEHQDLFITPDGEEIYYESGWGCPADEDRWIRSCIKRSELEHKYRDYEIECEDDWYFNEEMFLDECERNEWCDEDRFMKNCEERMEEEERWREEEENRRCIPEDEIDNLKENCADYDEEWFGDCMTWYECYEWKSDEQYNDEWNEDEEFCHSEDEINRFEDDCLSEGGYVEFYYSDSGCVDGMYCKHEEEFFPDEEPEPQPEPEPTPEPEPEPEPQPEETTNSEADSTGNALTGNVITGMVTHDGDDYYSPKSCEEQWEEQEEGCAWSIATCSEETYIPFCVEERKEHSDQWAKQSERWCERNAEREIKRLEKDCERFEDDQDECREMENKRCEELERAIDKCKEKTSPEDIKEEIREKVAHECRLYKYEMDYFERDFDDDFGEEDNLKEVVLALDEEITTEELVELATLVQELQESADVTGIKLYKGLIEPFRLDELKELSYVVDAKYNTIATIRRQQREAPKDEEDYLRKADIEDVLQKLLAIRQSSDIPEEYAPLIESYAEDLIDVSEDLEDIKEKEESKGFGYSIQNFLGLVKEAEAEEIEQIDANKKKIEESIEELKALLEQVPDLTAKATLQAQIDTLEEQKTDLEALMEKKEKKSKGWFSFLFN